MASHRNINPLVEAVVCTLARWAVCVKLLYCMMLLLDLVLSSNDKLVRNCALEENDAYW